MRPFILCAALGLELRFIMLTALPRFNASRRCTTSGSSRRHGRRPRSPEPNRITAIIKPMYDPPLTDSKLARCSLLLVTCSSQCRVSVLYLCRGRSWHRGFCFCHSALAHKACTRRMPFAHDDLSRAFLLIADVFAACGAGVGAHTDRLSASRVRYRCLSLALLQASRVTCVEIGPRPRVSCQSRFTCPCGASRPPQQQCA